MKTFSLEGESRYRIYRNWIYKAKSKEAAIAKFKSEKKGVKKVKATEVK